MLANACANFGSLSSNDFVVAVFAFCKFVQCLIHKRLLVELCRKANLSKFDNIYLFCLDHV